MDDRGDAGAGARRGHSRAPGCCRHRQFGGLDRSLKYHKLGLRASREAMANGGVAFPGVHGVLNASTPSPVTSLISLGHHAREPVRRRLGAPDAPGGTGRQALGCLRWPFPLRKRRLAPPRHALQRRARSEREIDASGV